MELYTHHKQPVLQIYMFSKDRYGKVSNWLYFCKLLAKHLFHIYEYLAYV